jgi:hypothetical protein
MEKGLIEMAKSPKLEIDVLTALKFVAKAQREYGTPSQMHCRSINGQLIGFDGVLACGMILTTPLPETCPNTFQFIHALERAKDASAITFENTTITVKTSKFKATVPCIAGHDMQFIFPDAYAYPLNDAFVKALGLAAIFTKEGAQTVAGASVLTRNGSVIGTDTTALIEVYHGTPTPEGLIIPKSFVDAATKTLKKVVGFGYTDASFTIWYEDQSWIKTQLYVEQWPNVSGLLAYTETANNVREIDKDFWAAVTAVQAFSEDGRIFFDDKFICSHNAQNVGAEYRVKDLPSEKQAYNYKNLLKLQEIATKFDFTANERMAIFFGENLRGCLAKMHVPS